MLKSTFVDNASAQEIADYLESYYSKEELYDYLVEFIGKKEHEHFCTDLMKDTDFEVEERESYTEHCRWRNS